jgi:hypothetical protein
MGIIDFINEFKAKKIMNTAINQNAVSEYIKKELEVKDYVPFAEKRELCERVLNACNHIDINSGLVKVDSVTRYLIFTISIISKYTNLEFSSGKDTEFDSLDEYDMLCQAELLNPILDVIGEEYVTCNNLLNMMMSDLVANHNTIENVLGTTSARIVESIDSFMDVLAGKVEELNLDLGQIDINKFQGLINKLTKK